MTKSQLRKRFPGLEIVEKTRVKSDYEFLRWQAHEVQVEDILVPAIPRLRAAISATVTTRRLVGFGATLEDLEHCLLCRYFPVKEAA